MAKEDQYYYGVGRRKQSIATARIYNSGDKSITINQKPLSDYFLHEEMQERVQSPMKLVDKAGKHTLTLKIKGGGLSSQADAARLAISNALVAMEPDLRSTLKRAGYLKRDARVKERKKYGLKRARKAPQYTKR